MMDLEPRRPAFGGNYFCWPGDPVEAATHQGVFSIDVDQQMVDYFSRPEGQINGRSFKGFYCLNPLGDDDCPVGICPNLDVAGLLVRIAHYITAFCLVFLIFHAPKHVKDAFYYQLSTVYALLITCSVSLFQGNLTHLHATIAITITASPVSLCFLVYSIRAFWGEHRLDTVLGKENYLNRGLVFFATGIWISIVVYTSLESTRHHFAQGSCKIITEREVFYRNWITDPTFILAVIAAFFWVTSIVVARKDIWPSGERYRPKFATVWRTISHRFPFVFYMSVGMVPLSIWVGATEWTLYLAESPFGTPDNDLSFGFGQVLALFIAVPPFLQVCQLLPALWSWFINLTWIAWCWRRKNRRKQSAPIWKPGPPDGSFYHTGSPVTSGGQNGHFHGTIRETRGSTIHLEPNRLCEV